jgi:putative transposase
VWRDLPVEGLSCGLHRIERLMRLQALNERPRRRRLPPDLGERQVCAVAPNVLDRSFEAHAPKSQMDCRFHLPGLDVEDWLHVPAVVDLPDALLHHSDRGSQYSSEEVQRLMADHGIVCSMSRSFLVAIGVNHAGYREMLSICEGAKEDKVG